MFRAARPAVLRIPAARLPLRQTTVLSPALRRLPSCPVQQSPAMLPRATLGQRTSCYATKNDPPSPERDRKHELKVAREKLPTRPPEEITADSTTVAGFEKGPRSAGGPQVSGDIKAELHAVRDAFALSTIPKEPNALGLAGTLPYLATSLSTLFLSWNINQDWKPDASVSNALLMKHDNAQYLLDLLEPIQIGYGAVIISFLGAIHWGMEWNEKTASRDRARARYAIGLVAPAIAWPTLLMPAPAALTTQFFAFTVLYFVDGRMTERGWAPGWYAPYRFVLTLVVGVAIFISLVGRARIGERKKGLIGRGLEERFSQIKLAAGEDRDLEKEEATEKQRRRREAEEEEEMERKRQEAREREEKKKAKGEQKEGKQGRAGGEAKNKDEKEYRSEGADREEQKGEASKGSNSGKENDSGKGSDSGKKSDSGRGNVSGKGSPGDEEADGKSDGEEKGETREEKPDPKQGEGSKEKEADGAKKGGK